MSTFSASGMSGILWSFLRRKTSPTHRVPMRHAGPLELSGRKEPCYRPVRQGGGAEEKESNGGGTEGELGGGLSGLWRSFGECDGCSIIWGG